MQTKLELIAAKAADNLKAMIAEKSDEIEQDMIHCVEASDENETDAVFVIGLSIKLNLGRNRQYDTLSWSKRTKVQTESEIEDPKQIALLSKN